MLLEGSDLPFEDSSFEGVLLSEVLSHALDVGGVLSEASRVLHAGGWIGVAVPEHGRIRDALATLLHFSTEHDPHNTEIRRFSPRTLAAALVGAGFTGVQLRTARDGPGARTILASARVPVL